MYDFLRGRVVSLDAQGRLSLEVQGVGYLVRVSQATRQRIALDGSPVTLFVRLIVREDEWQLIGFADPAERAAFDLLTAVQQVGPQVALAILSALGVDGLRRALLARDARALRAVKGVGPKLAERIVVELADRVERIPAALAEGPPSAGRAVDEAQRALVVLGFPAREAAEALAAVAAPGLSAEQLVRLALARLR
ncbi:MAG: Holliday junction branch migration protein RuvA [Planctomycetota bacterium]|nr:Holliday junction branch migration protein RuvA [Planctomycetota bacterium]MCX8040401.1 Holliday junction branch migration protein RuvA [Planctomycetota bacterium]MDW8372223.1 Holliday junction branch migration protein RuvA [Planctomycetota bacterium]